MALAHELAARGEPEGTLVWALRQEQGRGRLGRPWVSPEGGAYYSLILRPTRDAIDAPQIALVAGLAVAETIRDAACVYPSIRWPNDLLLGGKKLSGILVESRDGAVIVGVGINVTTDVSHLPPDATSLVAAGAAHCSLEDLISGCCRRMSGWYARWQREGFAPIREALRPWMGLFGRPVQIDAGSAQFQGTANDVDEAGRLVVRLDSGMLRSFDAGEVTLLR
jgi:BirA family biotin operon repressor/biotin-[acetyl-CoA-carboxylase] ligase